MNKNFFYRSNLLKIAVLLFLMVLPVACGGGGSDDSSGGGGDNNEPFLSACDGFIVTITGTEGNDNLIGTEGPDVIRGLGGNDTIDGRGGNDRICGDRGNDNILGGAGIDVLDGGPDDDIVDGQADDDIILEAPGSHDVLVGPSFSPGPQTLDEVTLNNALSSISLNLTTNQTQVVDEDGNIIRLDGFFPNVYGSFNPDSFLFSNAGHNGAVGHVFDPVSGGNDVWIFDAANSPANVIPELSIFDGILGPLQGDRTILIGDSHLNTVRVEKVVVHNFPPTIIDDGDEGYSAPGFQSQGGQGFDGDIDFSPAGGGNTAEWTFSGIPNGPYLVSATWEAGQDRATNAPFALVDGGEPVAVDINQELTPDDFSDGGVSWEILGNINVTSNELTVTLSDDADQFVIADAVRIEPLKIGPGDGLLLFVDNVFRNGNNLEFTPPAAENEVAGGFFSTQLEVPGNVDTSINFNNLFVNDLEFSMISRVTDMFLVSTTHAPDPGLSQQVKITLNLNGSNFEKIINQTQLVPSFTTAPNGSTQFQNLFLCRVAEPSFISPKLSQLSVGYSSMSGSAYAFDTLAVTPVNKFEMPFFGVSDADFDGDVTCVVVP